MEIEVVNAIKNIHRMYYGESNPFKDPLLFLAFHRSLEVLFNAAGITSTLTENNPDEMSPEKFKTAFGII